MDRTDRVSRSSLLGAVAVVMSCAWLLLIPLDGSRHGGDAVWTSWRAGVLGVVWIVVAAAAVACGAASSAVIAVTTAIGAGGFLVRAVPSDDGDGLWIVGLLLFLAVVLVGSSAAAAVGRRWRRPVAIGGPGRRSHRT